MSDPLHDPANHPGDNSGHNPAPTDGSGADPASAVEEPTGEVIARQQAESRRALGLSALAGLVFTGAVVIGLVFADRSWTSVPFLLGAAAVVAILRLADRHVLAYDHHVRGSDAPRRRLNPDPLATRRGYLTFHAERAGWRPGALIALVWATWLVPAVLFASLVVNAVYELARSIA